MEDYISLRETVFCEDLNITFIFETVKIIIIYLADDLLLKLLAKKKRKAAQNKKCVVFRELSYVKKWSVLHHCFPAAEQSHFYINIVWS